MSNSNHCVGRTLSLKDRKAYSGPQFGKTCHSVNFRHILANFILKWTKISHILFIIYSFKWKCGSNSLQQAALNKQWGRMRPAGRQFDKPAKAFPEVDGYCNRIVLIVNFCNHFVKALTKKSSERRALLGTILCLSCRF
jgi:hypothetical protein